MLLTLTGVPTYVSYSHRGPDLCIYLPYLTEQTYPLSSLLIYTGVCIYREKKKNSSSQLCCSGILHVKIFNENSHHGWK